jgi:DNA polymerase delta subunit 1
MQLYPGSRVVYGDTDSVMIILDLGEEYRYDMAKHFEEAQKLADAITETFKKPNVLEFEKAYFPFALYSKKRYAGAMYTQPHKMDKVDVKGLTVVRRDNAPIVREVSQAILDAIILRRSPQEAIAMARDCLAKVLRHEIPFEKFKVSKTLRGNYKNKSQPHVTVAEKLLMRTKTPVPSGTRVAYVFPKGDPRLSLSERAEDPDYAEEHGMQIDALFYIEHQLTNPLVALLEVVCTDPAKNLFGEDPVKSLHAEALAERNAERLAMKREKDADRREAKRIRINKENRQPEITRFFAKR